MQLLLPWQLRAAFIDRRVVFAGGLAVGYALSAWVAPVLSRVHISFDGPEPVSVYDEEQEREREEALQAVEDLGRIPDDELAQLDVIETGEGSLSSVPEKLKRPAKRAKEKTAAAKPRPVEAAAKPAVVLTAEEERLNGRRLEYIERHHGDAEAASAVVGGRVKASYLLALALTKGGSEYALKANNHFDLRCLSKTCPEGHCLRSDADDQHKWFFTRYRSAAESYKAQAKALASSKNSLPMSPAMDRLIKIYSLQNFDR